VTEEPEKEATPPPSLAWQLSMVESMSDKVEIERRNAPPS